MVVQAEDNKDLNWKMKERSELEQWFLICLPKPQVWGKVDV